MSSTPLTRQQQLQAIIRDRANPAKHGDPSIEYRPGQGWWLNGRSPDGGDSGQFGDFLGRQFEDAIAELERIL